MEFDRVCGNRVVIDLAKRSNQAMWLDGLIGSDHCPKKHDYTKPLPLRKGLAPSFEQHKLAVTIKVSNAGLSSHSFIRIL